MFWVRVHLDRPSLPSHTPPSPLTPLILLPPLSSPSHLSSPSLLSHPPPFPSSQPLTQNKKVMLPHLHPMMKYSPVTCGIRDDPQAPPQECHTHTEREQDMGVSITYSRHSNRPLPLTPHTSHSHHHSIPPSQDVVQVPLPLGHSTLNSSPPPLPPSHSTPLHPSPSPLPPSHSIPLHPSPSPLPPSHTNLLLIPTHSHGHLQAPPISGSLLAPPSLQAAVTHRKKPLTPLTHLKGHRITA